MPMIGRLTVPQTRMLDANGYPSQEWTAFFQALADLAADLEQRAEAGGITSPGQ